MEEDLDFFLSNNASRQQQQKKQNKKNATKKIKPHNTTRLKLRNFLTNISYNGVKEEVSLDRSFVFDVHVLTTKNFNQF